MRGSLTARTKRGWPALVAAASLLLGAPHAFASRTASQRPDLLVSPALQPIAATPALAPTYIPQGFALHLDADPHPATFALFEDLAPAPERLEPEELASGVESWALTPNLQRIQVVVAETWQVGDSLGPVDSPNLYQAFGLDPQNNTDPYGLCKWNDWECWGWVAKDFGVKTGYDLWNVASLGTLERVEQQSNLGTWEGVRESMTIAKDRIGNAGTLGAQDNLVAALESTGDLSGVPMAISKTAYDLTPMEEARVLIQEGDQLSTEQKIQLGLTGVSKTASLGAVAVGGGRIYSAYQEAGSVRALLSVRRAQLTRGGIKKVGDAGEAALREIVPDAQPQVKADIRIGGRGRRFDGQRLTPANQRIAYEVKNGPINRVPAQARWDAQALSGEYLVGSDWYLLRGGSPGALQTMRGMGLNLHNLGPVAPAWQVYHPGFTLFPAMQNTIGGTP